ncbi:SLATT domain-containing protein [Streptomyces sp. NPDC056390]|uniref:SLATT domain-containing protein n=1 Tax=Streptomyces sp. NPDC056390 TaxID=3345806 RepID=UPI0035DEC75D
MSDDAPPADGTERYPPWVFALMERLEYKGQRLIREDAFKRCPLSPVNWTNVETFIRVASGAGVGWLDSWSVTPHDEDQSRALVRFEHKDGGESIWKRVHIKPYLPLAPDPTWGDVISQSLMNVRSLYGTFPDIRRSPRGIVALPSPNLDLGPTPKESTEVNREERQTGAGKKPEEYESGSADPAHGSTAASHAGPEPEADKGANLGYEEWVYEVLPYLTHDSRKLSAEEASSLFPNPLNWSHVALFIDAAVDADFQALAEWSIFPNHNDLSIAVVWHSRDDGSGALWTEVSIESLISNDETQEDSFTWGHALEDTLHGLNHLSNVPDLEYSKAPSAPSEGPQQPPSEEVIRAVMRQEIKEAFEMGTVGTGEAAAEQGHVDPAHIERALAYRRTHAALSNQIRLSRISRFAVAGSALLGLLLLSAAAAVNAAAWGHVDLAPYNAAGGVLLALILVVFLVGRRMDTGQPKGEERKSVAALKLEVDLLEERRILEASTGARSSKDRQHSYRESIPQEIERLRRETRRYRRVHNFFQWGLFIASVAMMVTTAVYEQPQPGQAILIGLGAFVSLTTAVTGYFKYRERAFNLQQTSDAIEQHVTAYDLAIPPYNQQDAAANLEKLAENVEVLRVEQRKRQQQLEQPNQGQQEVI